MLSSEASSSSASGFTPHHLDCPQASRTSQMIQVVTKVTGPCGKEASPRILFMSAKKVEGGTTIGAKEGGGGGADTQTWRRESFALQTRRALPSGLTATPVGLLNRAAPPTPSARPAVLPATVVTTPVATSTRRILWLPKSTTNSALPSGPRAS